MDDDHAWIGADEFAELAGVSPQAARQALRRAASGGLWRGHALRVRLRGGRGGRAGFSYETCWRDLPGALQPERRSGAAGAVADPVQCSANGQAPVINDRWQTISEALAHPARSAERADAVAAAAARCGRSERTLHRWINRYGNAGVGGLARRRSPSALEPRVVVSRDFDRALRSAGHDEDLLATIAAEIHRSLKGLWASRAELAGVNEIRRLAEYLLLQACERHGVVVDKSALRLSRRAVERFAHYRVVNQRRNDRKAFDDAKPRIRRDWTGLAPMERIVGDVKHLDVIVTRDDGTPAWPKIVGFMDAGTGRVFVWPVLLERGEGVRQEHVVEAFLAMVSDPNWGFPQGLYLDNGSEFAALTKIEGALQLLNSAGARTLIFAKPYNASAKPIESLFARLDRYVFSMMPGYAGPNRMAKKTQTVGKPPKPYPGSWAEFCATLHQLIEAHNNQPVGGQWRDRSPSAWFADKVGAGWTPARVDALALDAAFSDQDSRRVDRGVINVKGRRFSHPALAALPSRTVVDLAMPWRRGAHPMARIPAAGWVYLEPEIAYPARWVEGARETSRRQRAQSDYVSALARDAPRIDPIAVKIGWSRQQSDGVTARESLSVDLGSDLAELGGALRRERQVQKTAPSAVELRRAQAMALTERLERRQRATD